jgi:DNA repair/transcription protein MET18/MMS19
VLLAARSVYAVSGATRREADERSLEPYREALLDVLREGVVRGMDELLIHDKDDEVR